MKKLLFYSLTIIFVLTTLAGCMGSDDKKASSDTSTNLQDEMLGSDGMLSSDDMLSSDEASSKQ